MKKYFLVLTAMLLICALALGLMACDDDSNEPIVIPEVTPGVAFADVLRRISESKNINPGNNLNINLDGYMYFYTNSKRLRFNAEVNNIDGKLHDMYFELNGDDKKLMGVYVDGKDCYVDLGEIAYKYSDVIGGNSDFEGGARDGRITNEVVAIAELLGGMVFKNVTMQGDDYTFEMNIGEIMEGTLGGLIESLGINFDDLAVFLGLGNRDAMIEELKNMNVFIDFDFSKDRFVGAHLRYKGNSNIDIGVSSLNITDAVSDVNYSELIPDKEYHLTNAINFKMNGEFILNGKESNGGRQIAKYDWKLLADIDPFNPSEDDRFHFVMTNRTGENSPEYNAEKISANDGVVLEIAYSPKEFGTDNILLAVNLKALLDSSILEDLGVTGSVGKLLPNYYGAFIDIDAINAMNSVGGVATKSSANMNTLQGILSNIKIVDGSISINRSLFKLFGENDIINRLLDTSTDTTESLELKVNFMTYGGNHDNYDISNHYFNIADFSGVKKNFGALFNPALSAEPVGENGFANLTTAYGKSLNNGSNQISVQELNTLIGGSVQYKFLGYNGKIVNAKKPVKILGVSGVDTSFIGVEQEISLITSMADGENLSGLLNSVGVELDLPINVFKTKIVLSEESSAVFTDNLNLLEYRIGDELALNNSDITLDITYADGENYQYLADGFNHNIPLINGKISASGNYEVVYSIGGRNYVRNINVIAPSSISAEINKNIGRMGEDIPSVLGKITVTYGEEIRTMDIISAMVSFPKGAIINNKFAHSGDYFVRVNAYGYNVIHRVNVLEGYGIHSVKASGSPEELAIDIAIDEIGEVPATARIKIVQERKILAWIKDKDITGTIDGVELNNAEITLPYSGNKKVLVNNTNINTGENYRQTIEIYSVDGYKLASIILSL